MLVIETSAEPLKATEPLTSPLKLIDLEFLSVVDVLALPFNAPTKLSAVTDAIAPVIVPESVKLLNSGESVVFID